MTISSFNGTEHSFLSNFYTSPIVIFGKTYITVEHAYQAMKSLNPHDSETIRLAYTPGKAKSLGKHLVCREDWDEIKDSVMYFLLQLKFQNKELATKLKETSPHELIEGNTYGDIYWGQCPIGNGKNMLGKLLMVVRDEL